MFIATKYEFNLIKETEEKFKHFCYFLENSIRNDKYSYNSDIFRFKEGKGMFDGYITFNEIPVFYFDFYTERFEIMEINNDVKNFTYCMLENISFEVEKRNNTLFSYLKKERKIKNKIISENQKEIKDIINKYNNYTLLSSLVFFEALEEFFDTTIECFLKKIEVTNKDIEFSLNNIDLNKFTIYNSNITKDIIDYLYKILI